MEVLNTGFHKVFKNIQKYDAEKGSMYTWIRTIVINSCIDYIKIKQKNIQPVELNSTTDIEIDPDIFHPANKKREEQGTCQRT